MKFSIIRDRLLYFSIDPYLILNPSTITFQGAKDDTFRLKRLAYLKIRNASIY